MRRHPSQPFISPLPRRKKRWVPYVFFFFSLFISVTTLISILTVFFQPADLSLPFFQAERAYTGKNRFTVLVMGVDSIGGKEIRRRSDTIMVFFVDRSSKKAAVLSIPRDSRVDIPGFGLDKINHAYAYGGLDLAKATVETLLEHPIDYYVTVDFEGFVKIVDLLGGVPIHVEKRMRYTDRSQNLYINLRPGYQKLNGYQAMGYVRFRHDPQGDFGRIQRQQKFIRAVVREALQVKQILQWPKFLKAAFSLVDTDMPFGLMLSLLNDFKKIEDQQIVTLTMPGYARMIGGVSFVIPDLDYAKRVASEFVANVDLDFLGLDIEVLNGTEQPFLAASTQRWLLENGIPVAGIGDARRRHQKTLLRFPRTSVRALEKIKSFFPEAEIQLLDGQKKAVIILGNDFRERQA